MYPSQLVLENLHRCKKRADLSPSPYIKKFKILKNNYIKFMWLYTLNGLYINLNFNPSLVFVYNNSGLNSNLRLKFYIALIF